MASDDIFAWTLGDIIVSFFELAIVYFMLSALSFAFFASKILNVLGLYLPCPCVGLMGFRSRDFCWHKMLIDWPTRKFCSVKVLVKSRVSCDSCWVHGQGCFRDVGLIQDESSNHLVLGLMDEGSSSSFSGVTLQNMDDKETGKRIINGKQRYTTGEIFDPVTVTEIDDGVHNHGKANAKSESHCKGEDDIVNARTAKTYLETIRTLQHELEEEKEAHAALYLELEKERAAAASAADEAMAMILRLQKEKALVEMEARQYQRMIEEKSAYDEEEMDILKEILLRKERENHFLDKELESSYLKNFSRNESSRYETNQGADTVSLSDDDDVDEYMDHLDRIKYISEKENMNPAGNKIVHGDNSFVFERMTENADLTSTIEPTGYDVYETDYDTVVENRTSSTSDAVLCNYDLLSAGLDASTTKLMERLRNDEEIERLRGRLRQVEDETVKMTFSTEQKERVNTQLQQVEKILNSIQQIQDLGEPVRQTSLPCSFSKTSSKKRNCRGRRS